MLQLIQKSWFSWDVTVHVESGLVGDIVVGSAWFPGAVIVGEERYKGRVGKVVWQRGLKLSYAMESSEGVIAQAERSFFGDEMRFEYSGARYALRDRSWWSSDASLVRDDQPVGSICVGPLLSSAGLGVPTSRAKVEADIDYFKDAAAHILF